MKSKKIVAFFAATVLSVAVTYGQARESTLKVDTETMPAVMVYVNQPVKVTSDALNQRMQRSGLKAITKKGITTYNRSILSEISPDQLDIYTKVERGNDNSSTVHMAVSRGFSGFTNSKADSLITVNIKKFLDSFVKESDYNSSDVSIDKQISEVNKDEKVYQHLLAEESDLNMKKSDIDRRLNAIQRELKVKDQHLTKKKADLESARTKRDNLSTH